MTLKKDVFYCCQVLDVRKRQLDDKMEENRRRQEESIESREELLRELEEVQRMTAREKAEEERKRKEREEEIQTQVGIQTKHDQHQISPCHNLACLKFQLMRIMGMIQKRMKNADVSADSVNQYKKKYLKNSQENQYSTSPPPRLTCKFCSALAFRHFSR